MSATEREQARRLGTYVDEIVMGRRGVAHASDALSPQDQEFDELTDLARRLGAAQVEPPAGFQDALAARLREAPEGPPAPARAWRPRLASWWPTASFAVPRLALNGVTIVAVLLLFSQSIIDEPVLSAQSVLRESDEALAALAGPSQVILCKWRVQSSGGLGMMTGTAQPGRIIEEWMDGADSERVAARWYALDGRLQVAYATVMSDGEYRPHVYFSPGLYGEARGLLNIEPTMRELRAALDEFDGATALDLSVYLNRHYIYAPIRGERHYNRAIFSPLLASAPQMPRVMVSFDQTQLHGQPVHRVRLVDSASVTFNWRSAGPSVVRIAHAEIVRFISRDSMLSVRTEERVVFEDGRRWESIRELAETDIVWRTDMPTNPFILDIPPGTPTRWQSAEEHLSAVAEAITRATTSDSNASR